MQFTRAPSHTGRLNVGGCEIAYATWIPSASPTPATPPAGEPGGMAIVLVHGAGAHMGWWDEVIDILGPAHRLVALDLSGHGDSGWRDGYTGQIWAQEVTAVAAEVSAGPCLVAGHSLGGRVAIVAAARAPDCLRGPVLVDAPVRRPGQRRSRLFVGGPRRGYDTLQAALDKFVLHPPEPVANQDLLGRIAPACYRQVEGRWMRKVDAGVFGRIDDETIAACLGEIDAPLTLVYGEHSSFLDEDGLAFLQEAHAGPTELLRVEGGHHHLMLDHAPAVAEAIAEHWSRVAAARPA